MLWWTIRQLRSQNPKTREQAAKKLAFGKSKPESAVGPLINALKDANEDVRWWAVVALGDIGDARAVEPLLEILQPRIDGDKTKYQPMKEHHDDTFTGILIEALGSIGDKRAVESIIQILRSPVHLIREAAAKALGQLRDEKAVEGLISVLKDRRGKMWAIQPGRLHEAQEAAAEALVQIGTPSVGRLTSELNTEDAYLRRAIESALYKITGKEEYEKDFSKPIIEIWCVHCGRSNAEVEMGRDIGYLGVIYARCSECSEEDDKRGGSAETIKRIASYSEEQRRKARNPLRI